MKQHVSSRVVLAFLIGAALSSGNAMQSGGQQAGSEQSNQQEAKPPSAKAEKWQQGRACVKNDAPNCPAQYRGVCRTARAAGCSHESCTAAKNQARANLRNAVPQECYPYIQSTAPCQSGPGCN
jgi:hypothetical protein